MKHHRRWLANITTVLAVTFTWGSSFATLAPMQDTGERLIAERSGASRLALDTVKQPAPQPIARPDTSKPPKTNLPANTKKNFWCEDDCAPKQRRMDTQQSKEQKTLSNVMKRKSKTDETIIQNMK